MPLIILLLLAFAIAWVVWDRSNTLFELNVEDGRVQVLSGQPHIRFLQVVQEVVGTPPIAAGYIRAVKTSDGVSLKAKGLNDGQLQRLRNTLRLMPQAKLRSR